jgi:LacI family transcriptional regulator/LacI family repressor for deo operon, udp, cdd, tsx, nupC, and nupG
MNRFDTKRPTIADVAARAGVAKSTVSAVLNHKGAIRDSTRRSVLRAMDELSYRPSRAARRGFRTVADRSIGFVVTEASNPYYAEVLEGIQDVVRAAGYLVFVGSSDGDPLLEHRIVEQCMEREFDGLIVTPNRHQEADYAHLFELRRHHIPFVLIEGVPGIRASLVDIDNGRASADAVRYLMRHGHSRIVHFAGSPHSEHSRERVDGVRRAFSESHLAFDDSMVVTAGHSMEDGYRAALAYFGDVGDAAAPGPRPTAVTCHNDLVALGVLKALRELSVAVPDDVSVVGFDDLRMLGCLPLGLTTVRVPKREMGRRAAEILLWQIESGADVGPERVSLDAELLVRDSTRSLVY